VDPLWGKQLRCQSTAPVVSFPIPARCSESGRKLTQTDSAADSAVAVSISFLTSIALVPRAYAQVLPTGAAGPLRQSSSVSPSADSNPDSSEPNASTSGEAFRWLPALAWGELGGWSAGAIGSLAGGLIWNAAGKRGLDAFVGLFYGFACAWPFGVAAGTYFYGTRIHGNGSFLAALAGSLLATASIAGLAYLAGGGNGVDLAVVGGLVIPPVASALGYYWTSSPPKAQPEVSLSLVHYDGRSGIGLGTPAVTVSTASGVRTVNVPLFSGRF